MPPATSGSPSFAGPSECRNTQEHSGGALTTKACPRIPGMEEHSSRRTSRLQPKLTPSPGRTAPSHLEQAIQTSDGDHRGLQSRHR